MNWIVNPGEMPDGELSRVCICDTAEIICLNCPLCLIYCASNCRAYKVPNNS